MKGKRTVLLIVFILLAAALAFVLITRFSSPEVGPVPSPTAEVTPSPSVSPSPSPSPSQEPYADKPEVDITSWELTLVNNDNLLSSDFTPELTSIGNGQYFDSRAADYLELFVAAAKNEGLSVYITSSYRSYATQQTLFNNKVNQYLTSEGSREAAETKARTIVAYPGTSEHQLGLACDIVDKYYEYMNESLADTELSKWMAENCAQYGFILRYPDGKQDITGVMYEPWHYRYVGVGAATYIMENDLCLEEFIALYK
jgi:D-alanyl-D-alanine carboxypeptidase